MDGLDEQEVKIVRELIRNPRISDNKLSKKTNIPVMTVNRKRKALENKGVLNYFCYFSSGEEGSHFFHARQLYIIQLASGITREQYLDYIMSSKKIKEFDSQFVMHGYVGEQDGRLAVVVILEAETEADLVELFNGELIKNLKDNFGPGCVTKIETVRVNIPIRLFHNYLPFINMSNGTIKEDWPNEWIFVDKSSYRWLKPSEKKTKVAVEDSFLQKYL